LWYERNNRIFSYQYQPHQFLSDDIFQHIQTHLVNLNHKSNISVSVHRIWGLQEALTFGLFFSVY
jgi:hypothetical protein